MAREACPICGEEYDDSDRSECVPSSELAQHVWSEHRNMTGDVLICWCGVRYEGLSIRRHIHENGGWQQHWLDHVMGVEDGV